MMSRMMPQISTADGKRLHLELLLEATLREALSHHARLRIVARFTDPASTVWSSIGRKVTWKLPGDDAAQFDGVVERVEHTKEQTVVCAAGRSLRHDLIVRTRSFASHDGAVNRLTQLDGFESSFRSLCSSLDRLDIQAAAVTQFNETDWQFLVRLARWTGTHLVPTTNGAEVLRTGGKAHFTLRADQIVGQSLEVSLAHTSAEVLHWNWRAGRIPTKPAQAKAIKTNVLPESKTIQAAADFVGADEYATPVLVGVPENHRDNELARRWAGAAQCTVFRWSGDLTNPRVRCGDTVELPTAASGAQADDLGVGKGKLMVVSRQLRLEPAATQHQLINHIDCCSAATGIPTVPHAVGRPPVVLYAKVIASADKRRLGMVRVRLPWEVRGGLWCQVPQPFAGVTAGAISLPAPDDWVLVVLQPDSLGPPAVLGSLYHGAAKVPSKVTDPSKQRLLFRTASGCAMMVDENEGSMTLEASTIRIAATQQIEASSKLSVKRTKSSSNG